MTCSAWQDAYPSHHLYRRSETNPGRGDTQCQNYSHHHVWLLHVERIPLTGRCSGSVEEVDAPDTACMTDSLRSPSDTIKYDIMMRSILYEWYKYGIDDTEKA